MYTTLPHQVTLVPASSPQLTTPPAALAHNYEEKDKHYLAAPLFLQALAMIPQPTCHSVVLSKLPPTSSSATPSPLQHSH